jgi:hypothetical protein
MSLPMPHPQLWKAIQDSLWKIGVTGEMIERKRMCVMFIGDCPGHVAYVRVGVDGYIPFCKSGTVFRKGKKKRDFHEAVADAVQMMRDFGWITLYSKERKS